MRGMNFAEIEAVLGPPTAAEGGPLLMWWNDELAIDIEGGQDSLWLKDGTRVELPARAEAYFEPSEKRQPGGVLLALFLVASSLCGK